MATDKKLKITLVRSTIGEKPKTRAAVRTLGLRKIDQVTERPDSADLRGVLAQVAHLVEVEEEGGGGVRSGRRTPSASLRSAPPPDGEEDA